MKNVSRLTCAFLVWGAPIFAAGGCQDGNPALQEKQALQRQASPVVSSVTAVPMPSAMSARNQAAIRRDELRARAQANGTLPK
jgi:hypothetical protein